MRHAMRRLNSPALAISAIALIVAIGGGTFAVAGANKNIKTVVKHLAPKLSVKHAKSADSADAAKKAKKAKKAKRATDATNAEHATNADQATNADNSTNAQHAVTADSATTATSADSASPAAFAHVSADGTLDAANSKNAGTVTKAGAAYCFTGIDFDPKGGVATVDAIGSTNQTAQFGIGDGAFCPSGSQAFVVTLKTDAPFYVVFYK